MNFLFGTQSFNKFQQIKDHPTNLSLPPSVVFFVINGLKKIAFRKKVKKLKENGVAATPVHKKEVDLASTSYTIHNTLFLLSIFNGWFVMIAIYGIGYYSNQHCGVSFLNESIELVKNKYKKYKVLFIRIFEI